MNKAILVGICLLSLVGFGNEVQQAKRQLTPEEQSAHRAKIMEMVMRRTGGKIVRPGSQKGSIVYVDCQKRAPATWLEESAAYFSKEAKWFFGVFSGAHTLCGVINSDPWGSRYRSAECASLRAIHSPETGCG